MTAGLPEDARIMKALTGKQYGTDTRLLALIVDLLQMQMWARGGRRGSAPQSLYKAMSDIVTEEFGFDTPEEFEAARQRVIDNHEDE